MLLSSAKACPFDLEVIDRHSTRCGINLKFDLRSGVQTESLLDVSSKLIYLVFIWDAQVPGTMAKITDFVCRSADRF